MPNRYFNNVAYPFIQGDTLPAYVFSLKNANGTVVDLSAYPALIVYARFREQGSSDSLAKITCTEIDASIGKYRIDSWPSAVAAAEEGLHELEIEIDYLGDATVIQTVYHLVKFKVIEQFGEVPTP